jgi:hypothetical protein
MHVHTTKLQLQLQWQQLHVHAGRTSSFVEFVDIFPTLSDLAGIAVPPTCPPNSTHVALCTEGVSLRPIFADPAMQVKRAAFSQIPHHGGGDADVDESNGASTDDVGVAEGAGEGVSCPSTVLGKWSSRQKENPSKLDLFIFENAAANVGARAAAGSEDVATGGGGVITNGAVRMDFSHCADCSFKSATGTLTPTGVQLTLRFPASDRVDIQVGTLQKGSANGSDCGLSWTTNSTDASGQWAPYDRNIPPFPPPSPPSGSVFMGYTMVTLHADGNGGPSHEYRYTEWPVTFLRFVMVDDDV